MLMIIVMITGDFLAMSLTTDRVSPSQKPNSWNIGKMTGAATILGICFLIFCVGILMVGKYSLEFDIDQLRTLSVVAIVYGSQATIYAIRDHRHFFGPRPTLWLVFSSVADISIISILAIGGILMKPLPTAIITSEFLAAIFFGFLLEGVKIPVFARLGIS
jgi:H+-transporting ATPase